MSKSFEICHRDVIDALNDRTILRRERPHLIFADPPFNEGVDYGPGESADRKRPALYSLWSLQWIDMCARWLRPDGTMWVLISEDWAEVIAKYLRHCGLHRRRWVIWRESFGVHCKRNFGRCARHLFYCVKDKGNFTWNPEPVMVESARQKANDKRATGPKIDINVWDIPRVAGTHAEKIEGFPNQLPIELLRRIVLSTSNVNDLVLDPFCGTGTTGAQCAISNRRFLGIDSSARACAASEKRITNLFGGNSGDK